ncbi:LOW QUALITY PROTEIN: extracellular calcium-sensing receptor-like [Leptodactylus fuscus]
MLMKKFTFDYTYSQDGDIILGGIFTVHSSMHLVDLLGNYFEQMCTGIHPREYLHLAAFRFAIEEINNRSDLLPNVTLGYHIYDSCGNVNKVLKDVLQILSGHTVTAPNYSCMENDAVVGFIGDFRSITTLPMAQLLSLYGYTQLTKYIKKEKKYLNEVGDWISNLEIINWLITIFEDDRIISRKTVGKFDASFPEDKQLFINPGLITWRQNQIPNGRCNEPCLPGTRKVLGKGYHICCYYCISCSEGEYANHSDSENCQRCPEDEWPNEGKNNCVLRDYEFFFYETDVLSSVFSTISILLSLITVSIIGIFTLFRNTPIVRANNRNLSFILLSSLIFSLLSVFLFIGRPVDITCMVRQICFGTFFTVAVSSVLAKTIIVYIAFKATRPDSSWRKCVGVKLPYSVVLVCSSIQIVNAVIWLSVSPPYQEYNLDYPGKIIIQCNEGSVLAFYLMLGYMGFLAVLSFVLAFMVRTLPDIYNEAKYITFSMLVFCSVWICAIPAYLSSTGKHMVIVEIFAILCSGGGILSCMFLPKCYNILINFKLNNKEQVNQKVLPQEHQDHVKTVLKRLRDNQLCIKLEKCEFHQREIQFLGYVISPSGLCMDTSKVQAIMDWPIPKNVKEVQRLHLKQKPPAILPLLRPGSSGLYCIDLPPDPLDLRYQAPYRHSLDSASGTCGLPLCLARGSAILGPAHPVLRSDHIAKATEPPITPKPSKPPRDLHKYLIKKLPAHSLKMLDIPADPASSELTAVGTEIHQFGKRGNTLEETCSDLASTSELLTTQVSQHTDHLDRIFSLIEDQDNRTRRKNVRFKGIPKSELSELLPQVAMSLFTMLLGEDRAFQITNERIHRSLQSGPKSRDKDRLHNDVEVQIYQDIAPSTLAKKKGSETNEYLECGCVLKLI